MSTIEHKRGKPAGTFATMPKGIILHGSRGGAADLMTEYRGTSAWAVANPGGLCWNATIGPGIYAVHLTAHEWGWNARQHSDEYLAVEFAQATVKDAITDEQVQSFADWYRSWVRHEWTDLLPLLITDAGLPAHSELPAGINDGKTDVFPRQDRRLTELRQRIRAALAPASEDALMEARWQADQARLGNKQFKGKLTQPYYTGSVLRCDRGLVTPGGATVFDGQFAGQMMDDWSTYHEQAGTLTRF